MNKGNEPAKNIILIGPMGAGKTSVARALAQSLEVSYFDTDEILAKEQGLSIAEIFASHNEEYFRELEQQVLQSFFSAEGKVIVKNAVIATGGGSVELLANRELISKLGMVYYLDTPVSEQLQRVKGKLDRPLLLGQHSDAEVAQTLEILYSKRQMLYLQVADKIISTVDLTVKEVAEHILQD